MSLTNTDLVFNQRIVIDGTGHVFGVLANIVAKNLSLGAQIVVINTDKIVRAGKLRRNLVERANFMRKRTVTNPSLGPFHHRAPSAVFSRTVRAKMNTDTTRGKKAFRRLSVFDGVPVEFAFVKPIIVPYALATSRFNPQTKSVTLAQICEVFGWTKKDLVDRVTEESLAGAKEVAAIESNIEQLQAQAVEKVQGSAAYKAVSAELAAYGL